MRAERVTAEMLSQSGANMSQQQEEYERRLAEMELRLQAKERELLDAKNESEAMKRENETMKRENETMKRENETVKRENEAMKRENETMKRENKELIERTATIHVGFPSSSDAQEPRVSTTSIKKMSSVGYGTLNSRHSPPYGTLDSRYGTLGSHSPRMAPALPTTLPPVRALGGQSPLGSPRGSPRMPPQSGISVPPLRLQPPSRSQSPQTRPPPALPQTAPR